MTQAVTREPDALAAPAAVEVRAVRKTFEAGASPTVALHDVTFDIARRDVVSFLGPSGCGKSTLLSLIAGLSGDYEGTIRVNGRSPAEARLAREYGMVFQEPALLDWRRVRDNVVLPLEVMGVGTRQERRRIADEMLALVGLSGFERHSPWQLSGGMQQRVSIARALAFDPQLLLMDEPFGALDEILRERMDLELLRIAEASETTVLFVTHSITEAVFLSHRVLVMSGRPGTVVADVPIDLQFPRTAETRDEPRFHELVTRVRQALEEGHDA
jgi:NitT/TauT family transport system ATP-binding protein